MVMMQCSGLGNALNAIGSLCLPYGIGVPMILSMRGTLGEANPSQVPMGRATPATSTRWNPGVTCRSRSGQGMTRGR